MVIGILPGSGGIGKGGFEGEAGLFVSPLDSQVKAVGVERKAASRYLSQLQDVGILKEYKIGREKIYINVELLELLKNSI